jgi:hypothetical protein
MSRCFISALPILLCPMLLVAQSESRQSGTPKVCVATVSNVSTVPAYLERLTEHLVKTLKRNKVEAISMTSSTTIKRRLRPTRQNIDEAEDKQCNYTLLTQIVEARAHPGMPQTIPRDGARIPSLDASDPMGGQSGPVYRENEQISFALFRPYHDDPMVDTYVLERASADVSDTFQMAMDRIANRVSRDLKTK